VWVIRIVQGDGEAHALPGAPQKPSGASGACVAEHTLALDDNTKRPRAVSCLAVNRDGTLFPYIPNNHEVHIAEYTGSGFNTIQVLKEHNQLVTSVDWAHNSDRIVTCSQDRNAYVWDGDRGKGWKPTLVHLRNHRVAT
jgi:WD40 repeat protein